MLYVIANILFLIFHTCIILFNLFGWIWKRTRKYNLVLLILTGLSWSVLGIWYGFGYCPFTEWHWDVLRKLGREPQTSSYIVYFVNRLTGLSPNNELANSLTVIIYVSVLIISSIWNFVDWRKKQNS